VTSFVLLKEIPDINSLAGIVLFFLGVYLLSIHDIYRGFLEPIKSLKKEKGARIMLIVAFLFSININFGKIMAINSSPAFLATFYMTVLTISYVIYLIATGKTYAIKN
jgi:drug/metabolite transporter (DMT)-like permease